MPSDHECEPRNYGYSRDYCTDKAVSLKPWLQLCKNYCPNRIIQKRNRHLDPKIPTRPRSGRFRVQKGLCPKVDWVAHLNTRSRQPQPIGLGMNPRKRASALVWRVRYLCLTLSISDFLCRAPSGRFLLGVMIRPQALELDGPLFPRSQTSGNARPRAV
jgi:hypothetical protein